MELKKVSDVLWEIPKTGNMKVPGLAVASEKLLEKMRQDRTLTQLQNVATLPGIYKNALVMPDGHEGYGFPIGGVAAFEVDGGVNPETAPALVEADVDIFNVGSYLFKQLPVENNWNTMQEIINEVIS